MTEFERPHYVAGKLLTADDLELEQRYHIEKRWLLNRTFHGAGMVHGLKVAAGKKGVVSVSPGFALDQHGREIEVCEREELAVPDTVDPISICIRYAEVETDRGTIRETYELAASTVVPEEAIVLAVLEGGALHARRK
jgi:hypothetical protein